ncbi:MAG: lipopolysaccharide kinase InaA family protein [Candidatus Neomarinimicrobiota bacterium]
MAQKIYDQDPNLVAQLDTHQGPVVIKWFGWRHKLHFYLSPLRPGRAWNSWQMARALEEAAARTPQPLFVYLRRCRGFIHENFYVTAAIHPHQKLRDFLQSNAPPQLMEQAVADLALSIARMHEGGIRHRDLTTGNCLVDDAGLVHLVDLNRARKRARPSRHQRLSDLARINFNARDQALTCRLAHRFFQVYSTETDPTIDWEGRYQKYRHRLLQRRGWKKRLRRLRNRKQADTVGV